MSLGSFPQLFYHSPSRVLGHYWSVQTGMEGGPVMMFLLATTALTSDTELERRHFLGSPHHDHGFHHDHESYYDFG